MDKVNYEEISYPAIFIYAQHRRITYRLEPGFSRNTYNH